MPHPGRLDGDALAEALAMLPDWQIEDRALARTWTFEDFRAAMIFVNEVARLAEIAQHHPDIDIRYNRVRLALVTHDSGGITSKDAAMAAELDTLA